MLDVSGPPGITEYGEEMIFTAVVSEEEQRPNLKYKWTVSVGEIIGGQGTSKLKVIKRDEDAGQIITATVEIIGLPAECKDNARSASEQICDCVDSRKIDEITTPVSKIEKGRLETHAIELNNNPSVQLYIIINHKNNASKNVILAKEKSLINALSKAGIEPSRFSILNSFSETEDIEFWMVPAGAEPPVPENKINLEELKTPVRKSRKSN